jgi:hypothetical protein
MSGVSVAIMVHHLCAAQVKEHIHTRVKKDDKQTLARAQGA